MNTAYEIIKKVITASGCTDKTLAINIAKALRESNHLDDFQCVGCGCFVDSEPHEQDCDADEVNKLIHNEMYRDEGDMGEDSEYQME